MEVTSVSNPGVFDPNGFQLSESAIDHFKKNLKNNSTNTGIRFSVSESSGCSGYTYSIDYEQGNKAGDMIFNFDNVHVYIDSDSFVYLKGTKVDFEIVGVNQGIKFHNPNVKAVCGCGESFEVDI
jgi:iron-sulfur cluster assembly protein